MSLCLTSKDYIEFTLSLLQLNMNIKETKKRIIQAGHKAVEELIKVAKEAIVDSDDDISADRLKNAAATKKLAIFDAFEILNRIQEEENILEGKTPEEKKERVFKGFAEGRSK
jgi:ASC-1-like (ASCH) protein